MIELSKQFRFDAAHTLIRAPDTGAAESSQRIHGHSYRAEVTLRGVPDPASGMLLDLGLFEKILEEPRRTLDHHFLDKVDGLGPATMENLCAYIWRQVALHVPQLFSVTLYRDSSGDKCVYYGPGL